MNSVSFSNIGKDILPNKSITEKKTFPNTSSTIYQQELTNILHQDQSSIESKKTFSFEKTDVSFQISKASPSELAFDKKVKLGEPIDLAQGITYKQKSNPKGTIRTVLIASDQLDKIGVLFKRDGGRINVSDTFKSGKYLVVANGTFFGGSFPAGDMKGTELGKVITNNPKTKPQVRGVVTDGEERIAKNNNSKIHKGKIFVSDADKRYTFAIGKDGKANILQGGLETAKGENYSIHDQNKYKTALGGGFLLFDPQHNDVKKANDPELYLNIESDPTFERSAPRSAIGIKADGSVLLAQFGEGKDRKIKGYTITNMVEQMKSLGCVSAVMFDGGGAPTIKVGTSAGDKVDESDPYNKNGDSYETNMSLIVISK